MDQFKLNNNPADPLNKVGPDNTRELFQKLSMTCSGFSYEDVVVAASNLMINAIRQKCATKREAERTYDELMTKLKGVMIDQHYDPSGKRRSVFAFHQTIQPDLFKNKRQQ